jgi:hypothetical protein
MLWNIAAMHLGAEPLDFREEVMFNRLGRQKPFEEDAFVLLPIRAVRVLEIECLDGTWDFLRQRNRQAIRVPPQ